MTVGYGWTPSLRYAQSTNAQVGETTNEYPWPNQCKIIQRITVDVDWNGPIREAISSVCSHHLQITHRIKENKKNCLVSPHPHALSTWSIQCVAQSYWCSFVIACASFSSFDFISKNWTSLVLITHLASIQYDQRNQHCSSTII